MTGLPANFSMMFLKNFIPRMSHPSENEIRWQALSKLTDPSTTCAPLGLTKYPIAILPLLSPPLLCRSCQSFGPGQNPVGRNAPIPAPPNFVARRMHISSACALMENSTQVRIVVPRRPIDTQYNHNSQVSHGKIRPGGR